VGVEDTRTRILRAALEAVAERGYRGATTRLIAQRAGVAELTLFRHFGSKKALVQAALQEFAPRLQIPAPSPNVEEDLKALAASYLATLGQEGELVLKLLPELVRHPDLLENAPPQGFHLLAQRVIALFRAHQEAGRLWREEPPERLAMSFVGPLIAQFLVGELVRLRFPPMDPETYVRGFLQGRRGQPSPPGAPQSGEGPGPA